MKIPKSFRLEKDLDEKVEELLKQEKLRGTPDSKVVGQLLETCDIFIYRINAKQSSQGTRFEGIRLANSVNYTGADLKFLSSAIQVKSDDYHDLGFYLSILANKIVPEGDSITLEINSELHGLGAFLDKDITLIIDGDSYGFAGADMKDGRLIINGSCQLHTGWDMTGGEIIIEGSGGHNVGWLMKGGVIRVHGNIESIYPDCLGTIYKKGKKVWPKDKL